MRILRSRSTRISIHQMAMSLPVPPTGEAIIYSELEKPVMSRSGDECVVGLTDQWYITYGESEWRKIAEDCLSKMNLYSEETRHGLEHTLSWLNQWACSRSFGLGTRIPWDEQFLVESLSDSSLYIAYYTVAHIFHDGDMYKGSKSLIRPQQMNDEVWVIPWGDIDSFTMLQRQLGVDKLVTCHTHQFAAHKHEGMVINRRSATGAYNSINQDVNPNFVLMDIDGLRL